MHREGHIGIGFLLYAPFAYFFFSLDWVILFGYGMVAIGAWSFLPDIDLTLPIPHRGPTHSLTFAIVAGLGTAVGFVIMGYQTGIQLAGIGSLWLTMGVVGGTGFVMGFLGVVGHVVGDVLTPMGVQPWWPRSDQKYSLDLVYAADRQANQQLSMIGAVALTAAIVIAELGLI